MKIRTRGICPNNLLDAPFIGMLVCAIGCTNNCPGCFNQHLLNRPITEYEVDEIITFVLSSNIDEGLILAGLEWTEQPEEMKALVNAALENRLKVMIYTGLEQEAFEKLNPEIIQLPIWVKYGAYKQEQAVPDNICFGVQLASKNQKIVYYG